MSRRSVALIITIFTLPAHSSAQTSIIVAGEHDYTGGSTASPSSRVPSRPSPAAGPAAASKTLKVAATAPTGRSPTPRRSPAAATRPCPLPSEPSPATAPTSSASARKTPTTTRRELSPSPSPTPPPATSTSGCSTSTLNPLQPRPGGGGDGMGWKSKFLSANLQSF
jgi:hypothetical protein